MSLKELSDQISFYYIVICLPIGILLDVFSIYIFSKRSLQKTNMGFLFVCKLSIDIILMVSYIFLLRSQLLFNVDIKTYSNLACSLFSFYRRYILHISGFMTVFISFDRFVYIHYSGKFSCMQDRKKLVSVLVAMFLVIGLIDLEKLLYHVVEKKTTFSADTTQSATSLECVSMFKSGIPSEMISILMRIHIPIILMFVFNSILIHDLFKSKSKMSLRNHRKEAQFTFSVLFSSVAYLVLYTPVAILFGIKHYHMLRPEQPGSVNQRSLEIFTFLFDLSINISLIFETFLFFIVLATNNLFRNEVWTVLRLKRARPATKHNPNFSETQAINKNQINLQEDVNI
jgi:hypothetical protein